MIVKVIFSVLFITFAMYISYVEGESNVRKNTIVRLGFPYYLNNPYFGTCADVRDVQTDLVGQACATDNVK